MIREDEDYIPGRPIAPLTVAEDEASLSTGTYFTAKVSRSLALVVGAVIAVALVGAVVAGRLSAPGRPASATPGPTATVTTTATERTGSTSVTTITEAARTDLVTLTPSREGVTTTATATDRILVPGPVRTVVQHQPALIVHVTTTRTVIRRVR